MNFERKTFMKSFFEVLGVYIVYKTHKNICLSVLRCAHEVKNPLLIRCSILDKFDFFEFSYLPSSRGCKSVQCAQERLKP